MNEVTLSLTERLQELYEQADSFAREVALFSLEASIPAHNQLRYAGHHFVKSVGENGVVEDGDELRKAIAHCQRAMYEAAETGIVVALDDFKKFETEYSGIAIGKIVPGVRDVRDLRNQARRLLARPRPKSAEAPEETSEYMKVFRGLRNGMEYLENNRHDLDAERDAEIRQRRAEAIRRHEEEWKRYEEIRQRQRNDIRWVIGILLTILGILIAIV